MPEAKGMWEGLMDFSFRRYATPTNLKFLYATHLLGGLIAGVAWVVLAFQKAPVQGLLTLIGAAPSPQQQGYTEQQLAEMVGSR